MAVDRARFATTLLGLGSVGLDSAILIYHLEGTEPYAELTEELFTLVGRGAVEVVLSTITIAELLVGPFTQQQVGLVAGFEHFVQSLPYTTLAPVSYAVARQAALLRARYRLHTPDALLVATALTEHTAGFVTNDLQLRRVQPEGITVVVLDEFV